jgi:hypothetical protein
MQPRKQFHWRVPLVNTETGANRFEDIHVYWDSNREGISNLVADSAAAIVTVQTKQKWIPNGEPTLVPEKTADEVVSISGRAKK